MKNYCKKCDKETKQSLYSKETFPPTLACNECQELNSYKPKTASCPVDPADAMDCISCQ